MFAVHFLLSVGEIMFATFWKLSVPSCKQQGGKPTQLGLFNTASPCYWANNIFPSSVVLQLFKELQLGGKFVRATMQV